MSGEVVAGVSTSPASWCAARWAADLAASRHLPLRLVHAGDADLDVRLADGTALPVERLPGPPADTLLALSAAAAFLVLGPSARARTADRHLRSPALALASRSACPVVVVRGRAAPSGPVVAGVDGSGAADRAIAVAFQEAAHRGVPLIALHTRSDAEYVTAPGDRLRLEWERAAGDEHRTIAERLAGWQERYPDVVLHRIVRRDRPRHHLLELSRRAQLVVVGSRGRGGVGGLVLGSTGRALAQRAGCPVVVVPPGGS
ncbi:universal stress protein [Amycolatopsis thermoflava]|uniref:universal stress protein n=1 Tax=Amycolatopsis thermoflava TaxID=84480 RepID=UPI003D74F00A